MSIIGKIRRKIVHRHKYTDAHCPLSLKIEFNMKPSFNWTIEVPVNEATIHVYKVRIDTIEPNATFSAWDLLADYQFSYRPTRRQYNKIINYRR